MSAPNEISAYKLVRLIDTPNCPRIIDVRTEEDYSSAPSLIPGWFRNRRFVDPFALFPFVPPSEVTGVGDRFDATPFDIENVFWSHRGPRCTFDTMVAEFGLETPPLLRDATDETPNWPTNRPVR